MSSTEAGGSIPEVKRFFSEELMPLAEKLRDEGKSFFAISPDPAAKTYYIKREKTAMTPASFELPGCDSLDSFEKALADMWTSQGYPELAALAPTLAKLAHSIYSVEEQGGEVSPFIYVMF